LPKQDHLKRNKKMENTNTKNQLVLNADYKTTNKDLSASNVS